MNKLIEGFKEAHRQYGWLLAACELIVLAVLAYATCEALIPLIVLVVLALVVLWRLAYDTPDVRSDEPTEFSTFWSEHLTTNQLHASIRQKARIAEAQAFAVRSSTLGGHAGGEL